MELAYMERYGSIHTRSEGGTVIRAEDFDKALSQVKVFIEKNDPNFFKELMEKAGFENVNFSEDGEGGYPTYDFVLNNGQKCRKNSGDCTGVCKK